MKKNDIAVLEQMGRIERDFQALKVSLLSRLSLSKRSRAPYREADIVGEVRKVRRTLWNGKYSKA